MSFIAAEAANKAGLLTLKGGLIRFKVLIIYLEAYPHPTLNPANP